MIKIVAFLAISICISLQAKTVVVTGASDGIGLSTSKLLVAKGYDLILVGRSQLKLNRIEQKIKKESKTNVKIVALDYGELSSLNDIQKIITSSTSIDGYVLVTPRPELDDSLLPSSSAWERMFKTGFIGPLELLKRSIPSFSGNAKVVIVSGITSKEVLPLHAAYGVLRAAWLVEAKGLSHQLGKKGIHVNTVSPGGTLTDSFLANLSKRAQKNNRTVDEQIKVETENIPLQKYGKPEEIAELIAFLLSNSANHISGANITIDGGFTRSY